MLNLSTNVFGSQVKKWSIYVNEERAKDEAVKLAIADLRAAGFVFNLVDDKTRISAKSILVGSPERNKLVAKLAKSKNIELQKLDDPQGYQLITTRVNGNKILVVSGGSILGDVYGLYWIWDRFKVFGEIPEMNTVRTPKLKNRFTSGNSKAAMQNALRYSANWVWGGPSINQLVPWDNEPERSANAKNRNNLKELIDYAHKLHLKFFVYEDEFSYHPSLMQEFRAKATPSDPAFWDAVQAKYRRLLQVLPEIDGVRIRTGEATRVGGNFEALDVMHDGENCDWSLAKRYRTYVKKMYNVIVGEFDKIYYQRTWVTSAHEQHSMATVYKDIFTDDIPVKNLYLSPYLSTTDRYFHQPYNPTFNLTPHNMFVLLATLDYHGQAGVNICPTYPGSYFQGGLQTILAPKNSNLRGADFGVPGKTDWSTQAVTAYSIYRLAWDPDENVRGIARDYAAMVFGQQAAEPLADILMASAKAYKYGIYIEPAAHGDFRSLPHLRLTTFAAKGLPRLDNGKKHVDFLYNLYLRCKPWLEETILYLDYGLDVAEKMAAKFDSAKPLIANSDLAKKAGDSVNLTFQLIKTNNLYVKTFLSYFAYRENPIAEKKNNLEKLSIRLTESMREFSAAPGCVYRLDGMKQLLVNVDQVLQDLPLAEMKLRSAPDDIGVKKLIAEQQEKSAAVLRQYSNSAVKLLHWKARVDGRDLLKVKANNLEIEPLRFDPIAEMTYEIANPLPGEAVTVIPVNIKSRSFGPFVLEQPTSENDFTAVIYLSDFPRHGYSWWELELYYIEQSPEELGLAVPW